MLNSLSLNHNSFRIHLCYFIIIVVRILLVSIKNIKYNHYWKNKSYPNFQIELV